MLQCESMLGIGSTSHRPGSMSTTSKYIISQRRLRKMTQTEQDSFAGILLVGPTLFFAKSAIFLIYLRLFGIDEKTRYGAWFGLLWTSLLYWTGVPIQIYCSAPVIGREWNSHIVDRDYRIVAIYSIVQGVLSVVLNLYMFLLPIPVILGLQISQKKRLWILGVFGTAIL